MKALVLLLALFTTGCESLPKGTIAIGVTYNIPVGVKK